jgi:cytochrome b involved in lipid metabolism
MSVQEFEAEVDAGRKLVIIDNLVLDISCFAAMHPGGKFALEQTIGRDISKYFYGGYSMLSNAGSSRTHVHSMRAL